jgi:Signal transduction histidine kinase
MKWKITGQFLVVMIIIAVTVVAVTIGSAIFYFMFGPKQSGYYKYGNPEILTLNFKDNMTFNDGKVGIKPEGVDVLKEIGCWIQVLDENGTEIYNLSKPSDAPAHYIPGELIYAHRFTGVIKGYTLFAGIYEDGGRSLTYLIGFPEDYVSKATIIYRFNLILSFMPSFSMGAFLASFIAIVIIGYIFSARLSKPIIGIIDGIRSLSTGNYKVEYPEKGLYKDVYKSLNNLSATLRSNEAERKKTETIREEWIANVSHDMKTPIASIKGYAELMSDHDYELSDGESEKYLGIIMDKSKYMEDLVEDLKLTYQLKSALLPLKIKEQNIVETLRDVVIDILNNPKFEDRSMDFDAGSETILMGYDSGLMKRALTNLIYNAAVHNGAGTNIWVRIYKDSRINIEIEDNGKGMAPEDLERLFDRYYRGTSTGEAHKGSGLGMAISKQIIEAHGGTIQVESQTGKGTKVNICF